MSHSYNRIKGSKGENSFARKNDSYCEAKKKSQILLALEEKAKNKTTQKGIKREIPRLTIKGRKWL